ncbi:MAG: sulfite exporter TauE/SafE family protein [Clostridia bacterium]|nr:sulfite exporter TauE/SafE family protein [Clostridia bacterium]
MVYVIGLAGGIVGGLFGAGSGMIILPAMVTLLKEDEYKARGTTLLIVLVITLTSAFFYYKNDFFDFGSAIQTAIGGTIGGFLGAKFMKKIPKFWLSIIFYAFMILVAIRMLL